jgi:hypothetical protein
VLIDVHGKFKIDKTIYNAIREKYGLKTKESYYVPSIFKSITVEEGYYRITDFGKLFIKACIK